MASIEVGGYDENMKKAIILTASTGGGHNKVAQTLEELLDLDYQVEVVDFLKVRIKSMR